MLIIQFFVTNKHRHLLFHLILNRGLKWVFCNYLCVLKIIFHLFCRSRKPRFSIFPSNYKVMWLYEFTSWEENFPNYNPKFQPHIYFFFLPKFIRELFLFFPYFIKFYIHLILGANFLKTKNGVQYIHSNFSFPSRAVLVAS